MAEPTPPAAKPRSCTHAHWLECGCDQREEAARQNFIDDAARLMMAKHAMEAQPTSWEALARAAYGAAAALWAERQRRRGVAA